MTEILPSTTVKRPTVISVFAAKGGTAKTTNLANLAGLLCDFGNKTLILDTDPQASCSQFYVCKPSKSGMVQLLDQGGADIDASFISPSNIDGLDMILSDFPGREGGSVLSRFAERDDSASCFKRVVSSPALQHYDYILIDTQGAVGRIQRSVVFATDILLSPFAPSLLDVGELLSGTSQMLNSMRAMSFMGLTMPGQIFALASNVPSSQTARTVMGSVRDLLESDVSMRMLHSTIKQSTHFQKNLNRHTPAHRMDRGASEMMHNLLWEILPQYKGQYYTDWQKEFKRNAVKGGV